MLACSTSWHHKRSHQNPPVKKQWDVVPSNSSRYHDINKVISCIMTILFTHSLPPSTPRTIMKTFAQQSLLVCFSDRCQTDWMIKISDFCFVLFCFFLSETEGVESAGPSWEVNPSLRIALFALPQLLGEITGEWRCGWLANLDKSVAELARKSISEAQQFCFNSEHGDQPEILYLKPDFNLFWFSAHASVCFSLMAINSWRWGGKFIYMENYLLKCLLYERHFVELPAFNYIYQL